MDWSYAYFSHSIGARLYYHQISQSSLSVVLLLSWCCNCRFHREQRNRSFGITIQNDPTCSSLVRSFTCDHGNTGVPKLTSYNCRSMIISLKSCRSLEKKRKKNPRNIPQFSSVKVPLMTEEPLPKIILNPWSCPCSTDKIWIELNWIELNWILERGILNQSSDRLTEFNVRRLYGFVFP